MYQVKIDDFGVLQNLDDRIINISITQYPIPYTFYMVSRDESLDSTQLTLSTNETPSTYLRYLKLSEGSIELLPLEKVYVKGYFDIVSDGRIIFIKNLESLEEI